MTIDDRYRALLDESEQLQASLTRRLEEARADDPGDANSVTRLETQVARATELIDLLESAVATAVAAASQPTS